MDTVIQETNDVKEEKKKVRKNWVLIPSIFILGFLPFVVYQFSYKNGLTQFIWYPEGQETTKDLLIGWKMIATVTIGALMVGILIFRRIRNFEKIKIGEDFYPLIIYGIFVIVSGVLSHYKRWAFFGTFEMLEPVGIVIAYLIICFYTYHYTKSESDVCALIRWAGVGGIILIINGSFQFLGLNFYRTKLCRMLISSSDNWNKISLVIPDNTVCPPFFNQNNACVYFAMIIPVILGCIIQCKNKFYKILLLILGCFAILCLIGTSSSAGCIALVLSLAISVFILLSRKKKTMIGGCCLYLIGIVSVVLIYILTPIGKRVSEALIGTPSEMYVYSIDTTGDCIKMDINGQILCLAYNYDENEDTFDFECRNEKGDILPTEVSDEETSERKIANIMYLGCRFAPAEVNNELGVLVTVQQHEWFFSKRSDEKYYMLNQAGKWEQYQSPEFLHIFNDNAFSKRGRIWNGSLKVILDHQFLLGSGANTFMFVYPQNDYIYRAYNNSENCFDVKAHNLYLQQWIENGILALCGFLLFFIDYLIKSIRLYRTTDFKDRLSWIGFSIFTGILTYLIAGLANDSNVSTAPVFWALMGVGMAVNRILKEKTEEPDMIEEIIPETKEEANA
ncbi:MAG: O-antigen ligase family protein [Agathobacter sp.]